jgi:hypothetical protein
MRKEIFDDLNEISTNWRTSWKLFLVILLLGLFHLFLTILLYKLFMRTEGVLMSSVFLLLFLVWLFCSIICLIFPFSKIARGFIIDLKVPYL